MVPQSLRCSSTLACPPGLLHHRQGPHELHVGTFSMWAVVLAEGNLWSINTALESIFTTVTVRLTAWGCFPCIHPPKDNCPFFSLACKFTTSGSKCSVLRAYMCSMSLTLCVGYCSLRQCEPSKCLFALNH